MNLIEIFTTLNALVGIITPIVVQTVAPRLTGGWKFGVAVALSLLGGFLVVGMDTGFAAVDFGDFLGHASAVLAISQVAWKTTWKSILQD